MNQAKDKKILDVRIDNLTRKEILEKVAGFLAGLKKHHIATVNPEFIIEAQNNTEFKTLLNQCDLNVADGIGIKFAFWRYGWKLKYRMTGMELLERILRIAEKNDLGIFLATNSEGLSDWQEAREAMLAMYPMLNIDGDDIDVSDDEYQILSSSCQVVFCNFGAPHQEFFINRQNNAKIRIAMGVGGCFDFLTKKVRRAPGFVRFIGLEWLWRLLQKPDSNRPRRWKRVFRAVIIFPVKILMNKTNE